MTTLAEDHKIATKPGFRVVCRQTASNVLVGRGRLAIPALKTGRVSDAKFGLRHPFAAIGRRWTLKVDPRIRRNANSILAVRRHALE